MKRYKEAIKIDKDGNESVVTISYKIRSYSARFMAASLSNLVDNLTAGIHKVKRNDRDYILEYGSVINNSIKYKCTSCNKDSSSKIHEESKNRFKNVFQFSNNDINKFILLLKKEFTLMSIWMNRKILMIHHCMKKKTFIVT